MILKFQSTLFIFTHFVVVTFVLTDASAVNGGEKVILVGEWSPIEDPNSSNVLHIAQFAVTTHNKEANTNLKLQRVVSGETQAVAGWNYRLVIAATDGGVSGQYEAVVWVKFWNNFMKLTSFRKL